MKWKCEVCGKDPQRGGGALYRVNPLGEAGAWRCWTCLTPEQRAKEAGEESTEIVRIIENYNLSQLRQEADKALQALYIAVEKNVADDVNAKVRAYFKALDERESQRVLDLEAALQAIKQARRALEERKS